MIGSLINFLLTCSIAMAQTIICPGDQVKHPSYYICDNSNPCPLNWNCHQGMACCTSLTTASSNIRVQEDSHFLKLPLSDQQIPIFTSVAQPTLMTTRRTTLIWTTATLNDYTHMHTSKVKDPVLELKSRAKEQQTVNNKQVHVGFRYSSQKSPSMLPAMTSGTKRPSNIIEELFVTTLAKFLTTNGIHSSSTTKQRTFEKRLKTSNQTEVFGKINSNTTTFENITTANNSTVLENITFAFNGEDESNIDDILRILRNETVRTAVVDTTVPTLVTVQDDDNSTRKGIVNQVVLNRTFNQSIFTTTPFPTAIITTSKNNYDVTVKYRNITQERLNASKSKKMQNDGSMSSGSSFGTVPKNVARVPSKAEGSDFLAKLAGFYGKPGSCLKKAFPDGRWKIKMDGSDESVMRVLQCQHDIECPNEQKCCPVFGVWGIMDGLVCMDT